MGNNAVQEWLKENRDAMIRDIVSLVNIESVSVKTGVTDEPYGQGCRQALHEAINICRAMGFNAVNHENQCTTFLWPGSNFGSIDTKEIGIFGHLDVVPAGTGWTCDPFSAVVQDDIIIGRGASDNKGAVIAVLYALKYLKEVGFQPKSSIRVFLGCNEEDGMKDVEYYVSRNTMPDFSFTPDVKFPVCYGEKGVMNISISYLLGDSILNDFSAGIAKNAVPGDAYAVMDIDMQTAKGKFPEESIESFGDKVKISAKGIAAHSAFPEGSVNAQVMLAEKLLDSGLLDKSAEVLMREIFTIFSNYYGEELGVGWEDDLSGRLTHVGSMARINSGVFSQNINIRYNIKADRKELVDSITKTLGKSGFSIDTVEDNPPNHFPAEDEIVLKLTEIANKEFGTQVEPYVMGGGTYARKLRNAIGFGPGNPSPVRRFGKERGGAHQPDEYVEIHDLMQAVAVYIEAIPEIDRMVTDRKW